MANKKNWGDLKIGVLALQGAFIEHTHMLQKMGVTGHEVRQKADWTDDLDGLILPGGESTVMGKLLKELDLMEPIKRAINGGLPVMGTCAGLILLAKKIDEGDASYFSVMDICVRRNAYGRQLGSFTTHGSFADHNEVPLVFIRAPVIISAKANVEILSVVDGQIVAARQGHILGTAFHPELTASPVIHEYFMDMVTAGQPGEI